MTAPEVQSAEREVANDGGGTGAGASAVQQLLGGILPAAPVFPPVDSSALEAVVRKHTARRLVAEQVAQDYRSDLQDVVDMAASEKLQAVACNMNGHAAYFGRYYRFETLPVPGMPAMQAVSVPLDARLSRPPFPVRTPIAERSRMFADGTVVELGDADETPADQLGQTPDAAFYRNAEAVFDSICRSETGVSAEADFGEFTAEERQTLKAQSHAIAVKLVESGREAYRHDMWNLFVYHLHTRHLEELPKFRRVCLLPYVAAMVRAGHLRALEHWLQRHRFCRFWTFTSGERCKVEDLRARLTELHGRISDLNAYLKKRGYPVQIVFRSSELGTVETCRNDERAGLLGRCPETGVPLYHPHAHCVAWLPNGRLEDWRWKAMLEDIHAFWGDNWKDGAKDKPGPIRNPKECVKYMLKPGEVAALSPDELGALHDALFMLKMVQPMGELALEIRARRNAGLTLVKMPSENGEGALWQEIVDVNKGRSRRSADPKHDADSKALESGFRLDSKGAAFTAVMARLVPAFGPLGVKEPRLIIATNGARPDMDAVRRNPMVQRITAETRPAFAAAFINVHKGTATVTTPFVIPAVAEELAKLSTAAPPVLSR